MEQPVRTSDVLLSRAEHLKALGHPIRLQALTTLGDGDPLTNRELAARLGLDPGHLHFHVRMLLHSGLIERVDGGHGREKPYRAVARTVRVSPELVGSAPASDVQAAMINEVQSAWAKFGEQGRFRSVQLSARLDPDQARELIREFASRAADLEDASFDPLVITAFAHPPSASA